MFAATTTGTVAIIAADCLCQRWHVENVKPARNYVRSYDAYLWVRVCAVVSHSLTARAYDCWEWWFCSYHLEHAVLAAVTGGVVRAHVN